MITQTHLIPEEEKPCKPNRGTCTSDGYLKTDNFLAEYSGNPAPVLNNLGVYSKDLVDKAIAELDRLVSVKKLDGQITITDNHGKFVSFRVLGGDEEAILSNFERLVNELAEHKAVSVVEEFGAAVADLEILSSGLVEAKINDLTPGLAQIEIENSGIVERKINEIAPGLADLEIEKLVPEMAYSQAEEAIKNEAGGIIKEVAQETVHELTSDIAKEVADKEIEDNIPRITNIAHEQATLVANEYVEQYLTWELIIDPDDEQNPLGEGNGDTTSNDTEDESDESGIS